VTRTPDPSFELGDVVCYHHDSSIVLCATVLGSFDDGYVIQVDPPGPGGPSPELRSQLLDEINEFFVRVGEEPLDYQDALFVDCQRLRRRVD
jgi:hypothetical protein